MTDVLTSGSRGIRNNNPGNIRKSLTVWAGQTQEQKDPAFVQFIAPEYGIRAMAKILKNYFARGVDTLEAVVATWAPQSENDTASYIASVSRNTNLPPNAHVTNTDLPRLIAAIIQHENGSQPYPPELIAKGVSMS